MNRTMPSLVRYAWGSCFFPFAHRSIRASGWADSQPTVTCDAASHYYENTLPPYGLDVLLSFRLMADCAKIPQSPTHPK